ncbi:Na(+)-translocating NADH-quinone reductase subunit F [Urechidicola croceus]|uniref:Na(+)-translocating NADH-quinone reductase subunit F n=1 Tax=Urechidicola croceus TaxID=1850246 RepID=A0A1D8P5E8_9FLAO|nr:Na(+)-translocating NADH-quinone reductase subunit F [Urechidicola croceus]AOW19786.1 Na(+)-translocating NADH-quinone reductase subunit F [Urechidicola croceus]
MVLSERLDNAIQKLYVAFHNDTLIPECSKQCAVGNICDNTDSWKHLTDIHGSSQLNYVGLVHQRLGRKFYGYSPIELLKIETIFLKGCGFSIPYNHKTKKPIKTTSKDILFDGLCAVISYLCELDDVDNVMDYSKLFEFENTSKNKV